MSTTKNVTCEDVDQLRDEVDYSRALVVENHLRLAELLSDRRLRGDVCRRTDGDGMHPDEVAAYARIAESGLSQAALEDDSFCLLLPPDLRSLELLARLTP